MQVKLSRVARRMAAAVVVIVIMAGWFKVSDSLALRRWQQEMLDPGLPGKTVIIDPGHGGADPGAMTGEIREAEVNMELASVLKSILSRQGVKVQLTRQGETGLVPQSSMTYFEQWLILEKRKNYAQKQKGHFFLSIHANASVDPSAAGSIVFYADETSRELAESIQNQLNLLNPRKRPAVRSNFTILNGNAMPSVLIEAGFITNKHDRELLLWQPDLIAGAISKGLQDYAQKLKPGTTGGREEAK